MTVIHEPTRSDPPSNAFPKRPLYKMKMRMAITICLSAIFLGTTTQALSHELNFLPNNAISIENALGAFPDANSSAQTADLNQVLAYQASRTDSDCKRGNFEANISVETFFGPTYGPLTEDEVNEWSTLLTETGEDADYFASQIKKYWGRDRPFVVDDRVNPCLPEEHSKSYPSAHATLSRAMANVLSLIDPTRKQAFLDRANQIALDRVIGGVHYPTDIAAGQELGDEIFGLLQQNSTFQTALAQAPQASRH
jgi:acid phosphatase (class A)